MTRSHKIEAWIALLVAILLTGSTIALIEWHRQRPLSLRGAVLSEDSDPRKQRPIPGVQVSAGELGLSQSTSNSDGFFVLKLRKPIRQGHAITLHFRDSQYRPLDVNDFVGSKLYIVHLVPLSTHPSPPDQPEVKIANVRVRYTSQTMTELNVGSSVKTFEIANKGNVPCNGHHPCSPDGKWKAAAGSASLDAGAGNEFHDGRASCIAGPCPFTKIDSDRLSQGGQIMTVSARDWSDTATFLLEAEVFRPMASQIEHWSYPVIFGEGLSFTLPSDAESVSMEADLDGQTIIFPIGPALFLSWATCDAEVNPDRGRVYRCALKTGYRFQ
ncbi:MAG: hypothetical protein WAL71_11345 [Terriglobales bacterium]|jgi:hypothetical protein